MTNTGANNNEAKLPPGLVPSNQIKYVHNGAANAMPNVLLCFKCPKAAKDLKKEQREQEKAEKAKQQADDKSKQKYKKRSKSCELRGGILYRGCDCEKRNGLQDDCQRSECRGSPKCLTNPPTCGPSEFANAKHQTKKFEEFLKARREARQRLREDKTEAKPKIVIERDNTPKVEYDCFPLELIMDPGSNCPLCAQTMNTCPFVCKQRPDIKNFIDVDDCFCCPNAC